MPYIIERRGNQWCVVGPNKTHGCHDSRADAIKQQRALYKNAPEAADNDEFILLAKGGLSQEQIETAARGVLELAAAESGPDVSTLGMVAVYPASDEAETLAIEGGHEPADLHVTLVFLGEAEELPAEAVTAAVAQVARELGPVSGTVGGVGRFSEGPDGVPVLALPDVQGLTLLRERIVDELGHSGVRSPSEHGFLPHMTLAYMTADEELDLESAEEKLGLPLTFDTVSVVLAGKRYDYKLSGSRAEPTTEASSDATATMTRVEKGIPIKDLALLRMAVKRSERRNEQEVEQAITIAAGLNDPEVAAQTVAVIGHLADRLKTAELNQAALVDVLQGVAADSTASRSALLEALSGITERLAEAPQVNVTVPVPEVNVNVEGGSATTKQVVELERDSAGRLTGATASTVPAPSPERTVELKRDASGKLIGASANGRDIELKRDSAGKLVGAVVEKEEEE